MGEAVDYVQAMMRCYCEHCSQHHELRLIRELHQREHLLEDTHAALERQQNIGRNGACGWIEQ